MEVKVKKLDNNAQLPHQAKSKDFCYDVWAVSEREVAPNIWEYGLGLAFELVRPESKCFFMINPLGNTLDGNLNEALSSDKIKLSIDFRPRSSIWKTGMILSNCEGTIDELYRGEVKAYFYQVIPGMPRYKVGDRIGQIKLGLTLPLEFKEVDELDTNTERGTDGFGSTGIA